MWHNGLKDLEILHQTGRACADIINSLAQHHATSPHSSFFSVITARWSRRTIVWSLWASFTNSLRQRKPSFGVKIVPSGFTREMQWQISAKKRYRPYWICISRSFTFRRKIYRSRVFKCITQRDLITFVLIKLLVFAPSFNAQKT